MARGPGRRPAAALSGFRKFLHQAEAELVAELRGGPPPAARQMEARFHRAPPMAAAGERIGPAPDVERVGAPLRHVARHVPDAEGAFILVERSDRLDRRLSLPGEGAVRERPVEAVSPGEEAPIRAAGRLLPFRAARQ